MSLLLVGINHTTASIALREKVAFPPDMVADALRSLAGLHLVEEAVIVSTCNRTEVYLSVNGNRLSDDVGKSDATATGNGSEALLGNDRQDQHHNTPEHRNRLLVDQREIVVQWLGRYHQLPVSDLQECIYFYGDDEVVRHLMEVSCGLDSMILGEPQILGQIKSAYAVSQKLAVVSAGLGRVFEETFSIAKEVRTDTAIGENPVSVAYAAVTLAERIFSNLASLSVLLIGAGRTIELVARHLIDKGVTRIVVANRTLDNALEMAARFNAQGTLLSDIPEQLVKADVVVSSTNSQLPLLGKGAVERALKQRRYKPMLLVDLAVPRDIEQEVSQLADAYLYSIDDISGVIEDSQKSREEAASQAKSIIERGVEAYRKRVLSLGAVDTVRAFREKANAIRELELAKAQRALEKGEGADKVLENLARALTNKLIHSPSVQMRQASSEGSLEMVQLVQKLYELDQAQSADQETEE
ncbi:MAG: glutamyl-tRNA reductase [Gammaproteobacteria bacterium]|nr:glutamyl-tRNA reductase [Gammaproteobacteria bacterium]MCY4356179.1 glutamyl-tRNA reductase [Gammaproteobacteria bacterium]